MVLIIKNNIVKLYPSKVSPIVQHLGLNFYRNQTKRRKTTTLPGNTLTDKRYKAIKAVTREINKIVENILELTKLKEENETKKSE